MQLTVHIALPALLVLLVATVARSQTNEPRGGSASLRVYADDNAVTVVTPAASVQTPLGRDVDLDASALVDIISAASIDVLSQASSRAFQDQRVEAGLAVRWQLARRAAIRGSVVGSIENDYMSLHLGAGTRVESSGRQTTVDIDYVAALDEVGRQGDPAFSQTRYAHRLSATLTQVLGPKTLIDIVADGQLIHGYQANPYRFVPIESNRGARIYSLPERTPDVRVRGAALLRLRRAFGAQARFFLHGDYRFYIDSWSILSHTATVRGLLSLGGGLVTLSLDARGYYQSAAGFYRPHYIDDGRGAPAWRSRDRTLGGVVSVTGGGVGDIALGRRPYAGRPHLVATIDVMRFYWLDYPPQNQRNALVATLGVQSPF